MLQTESAWAEEYLEKKRSSHKRSASWGSNDQLKEVRNAIIWDTFGLNFLLVCTVTMSFQKGMSIVLLCFIIKIVGLVKNETPVHLVLISYNDAGLLKFLIWICGKESVKCRCHSSHKGGNNQTTFKLYVFQVLSLNLQRHLLGFSWTGSWHVRFAGTWD